MKKTTCFYILFLLPLLVEAQPKIKQQTLAYKDSTEWKPQTRIEYTYNERAQQTSQVNSIYENGWVINNKEITDYDADGNKIGTKIYNRRPDSTGLYLQNEREYVFNESTGCLEKNTWKNYSSDTILLSHGEENYFYGPGCRIDSVLQSSCNLVIGQWFCYKSYQSFKYDANGNKTVLNIGDIDEFNEPLNRLDSVTVWSYDDLNRVIERISISDIAPREKWVYQYNADGEIVDLSWFLETDDGNWRLDYSESYDYSYDLSGFLTQKEKRLNYPSSNYTLTLISAYINHCDGLPKFEFLDDYGRVTYEYTEGIDCGYQWAGVEPTIAPNPVTDYFTIQWPKMEKGKAAIALYNALGSEVTDYRVDYRTEAVEVDVSQLPTGIYFLRIKDGKQRFGEKILVHHSN